MVEIPVKCKGGYVQALVDDKDAPLVSLFNWYLRDDGAVAAWAAGCGGGSKSVRLARMLLGLQRGDRMEAHHNDGNKLNCQRSNLRLATHGQSMQACTRSVGTRGVSWARYCGRWRAYAALKGRQNHIGYFDTAEEAAKAASEWRRQHMPFSSDARMSNTSSTPEGSRNGQ
jgi:hypothetical protein